MRATDNDLIRFNRALIAPAGAARARARQTCQASVRPRIMRAVGIGRDETWAYLQAVWASAVARVGKPVRRAQKPVR